MALDQQDLEKILRTALPRSASPAIVVLIVFNSALCGLSGFAWKFDATSASWAPKCAVFSGAFVIALVFKCLYQRRGFSVARRKEVVEGIESQVMIYEAVDTAMSRLQLFRKHKLISKADSRREIEKI